MRGVLLLILGGASGIVGAVLLFTVTDTFDTGGPADSGGGNARIEIHEEALATLIESRVRQLVATEESVTATTTISDAGLIEVSILIGEPAVGETSTIVLDPDVIEGALQFEIVSSDLEGLPQEAQTVAFIMGPLYSQLDALGGGLPYRLVAITTRSGKLTLDVTI